MATAAAGGPNPKPNHERRIRASAKRFSTLTRHSLVQSIGSRRLFIMAPRAYACVLTALDEPLHENGWVEKHSVSSHPLSSAPWAPTHGPTRRNVTKQGFGVSPETASKLHRPDPKYRDRGLSQGSGSDGGAWDRGGQSSCGVGVREVGAEGDNIGLQTTLTSHCSVQQTSFHPRHHSRTRWRDRSMATGRLRVLRVSRRRPTKVF